MRRRARRWTMALLLPVVAIAACQPAAEGNGDDGPMLSTAMDTILYGRSIVIRSGCGDCHGGGDNPTAPNWLVGMRYPDDTLLLLFKVPTPGGIFLTRPRNLTPDNETGLGRFTERQIFNALRYGLRPGETPDVEITSSTPGQGNFPAAPKYLAPPMPWPVFRHNDERDLWAIAAYLKRGLKPQVNRVEPSEGPPDFWAGLYGMILGPMPSPAFPTDREQAPPQ